MRKSLVGLLVLLLGITLVIALAGDKDKKSSEKPGEMTMGMPPMPTAELAKMEVFLGTWSGEEVLNFPQMPPNTKTKSTFVTKKVLGGRFFMSTYKSGWEMDGKWVDFEGMSLSTYDPVKKSYREWWFDSDGAASESKGRWADDKTYVAESSGEMMGQSYQSRGTTKIVSSTKHVMKMEMDMGEGWFTAMEGTYTKQAPAKANK